MCMYMCILIHINMAHVCVSVCIDEQGGKVNKNINPLSMSIQQVM